MKLFHFALAGAFAAFTLAGCVDDTGKDDTDTFDTGPEGDCNDVETLIDSITYICDSAKYTYGAETSGWTTDGVIDIYQNIGGVWEEQHDLPSVDYSPTECWDQIEKELPIVTDWESQEDNVNTLYQCDSGSPDDTLTWMIRVYDTDGVMSDCAVWGAETSYYDSYECLNWNS